MNGTIDVFIVGAPKCGTTALFKYLGEHPGIYVPDFLYGNAGKAEANHFASDFLDEQNPMRDRVHYLSFFKNAGPDQILCDASVFHLYSSEAPAAIHAYNPDAKIIIMLRDPVDFMFSYFKEVRFQGIERASSFARALDLEEKRMEGQSIDESLDFQHSVLGYRKLAHFSVYVKRYLEVFPRKQILFIKADDFFADTKSIFKVVLDFIGVEEWYPASFPRVNPSKTVRSVLLQKILLHPPKPLVEMLKKALGEVLCMKLAKCAGSLNRSFNLTKSRDAIPRELATRLHNEFHSEVDSLSGLTGLDLSNWLME